MLLQLAACGGDDASGGAVGAGGTAAGGASGSGAHAGSAGGGASGGSSASGGSGNASAVGGAAGSSTGGASGGAPQVEILATDTDGPRDLDVDGDYVYWVGTGLNRIKKTGGTVEPIVVTGADSQIESVDVFNDYAYFTPWLDADERVWRVPISGGNATLIAQTVGSSNSGKDLVVDGTNAFWLESSGSGAVGKVDVEGGNAQKIANDLSGTTGIDTAAGEVFWSNWVDGKIKQVSASGGAIMTLAEDQSYPWAVRIQYPNLYWVNRGTSANDTPGTTGSIMVIEAPVPTPVPLVENLTGPHALDVDPLDVADGFVYFTNYFDGNVAKVPRTGGAMTVVATNQTHPTRIVVDATHVYWIDETRVLRIAKGN